MTLLRLFLLEEHDYLSIPSQRLILSSSAVEGQRWRIAVASHVAIRCAVQTRAWTASGRSNDELIDNLVRDGVVTSKEAHSPVGSLRT